jgi:hypothetical protein
MSTEEEILDFKRKRKTGIKVFPIYGAAFMLFLYWFAADLLHWPGGFIALIAGMILLLLAAVIRFRRVKSKTFTDYAYLAGRITLIVGVTLHVSGWPRSDYFLWAAFACFGSGLLAMYFKRSSY